MFPQLRQQAASFWASQSRAQRIVLAALALAAVILVPVFFSWATTPSYSVAFSGLSETDAGQIVDRLTQDNIPYQLRNGTTILVPTNQVYEMRLRMAKDGLPEGGTVGFELFSGNTLGMTEFTQRVNYQRALEGELERTIGSMTSIDAVRVHIVTPEKALLSNEQAATTASITVKEKPGRQIDAAQVRAITHLVASSVEGLKPEDVVVIDINGNLLASGEQQTGGLQLSDDQRTAEVQAARELQRKVQDLLDTSLGPNKSVVQASVEMDWTQRQTTTSSFDPALAVVRSMQEVTETYTTTNATVAGVPGTTPNLPPAGGGLLPENQAIHYQRHENTTNFEITQVETQAVEPPGKVKRVALSVLVDGISDPAQLNTLRAVIAAAAGIDQARGDQLAVESLAFDHSYSAAQAADLQQSRQMEMYVQIAEVAAGILILLLLLWYVQRLLNNLRLRSAEAWTPILKPVGEMNLPGAGFSPALAAAGAAPSQLYAGAAAYQPAAGRAADLFEAALREGQPAQAVPNVAAALPSTPEPVVDIRQQILARVASPVASAEEEQLEELLIELAESDPSNLATIIQIWLNEDDRGNA